MNISVLNAHSIFLIASDLISEFYPLPKHTSFYQSIDFNNKIGLRKIDIKFKNFTGKDIHIMDSETFNLCVGFKYRNNDNSETYPFVDFSLYKYFVYHEDNFTMINKLNLLEHETKIELIKNYNWIQYSLNYGYNLLEKKDKMYLVPLLHLSLGLNTYQIDTVLFNNLDQSNLSTQYTIAEYGILLFFQYKRFSIEANYNKYLNFGKIIRNTSEIKMSYEVHENYGKRYSKKNSVDEIKFVSFDLSYKNSKFEFEKKDPLSINIQEAFQESINFSITFNLDWVKGRRLRECAMSFDEE